MRTKNIFSIAKLIALVCLIIAFIVLALVVYMVTPYINVSITQNGKIIKDFKVPFENAKQIPISDLKQHQYVKSLEDLKSKIGTFETGYKGTVTATKIDQNKVMVSLDLSISKLTKLRHLKYGSKDHSRNIDLPTVAKSKVIQSLIVSANKPVTLGFLSDVKAQNIVVTVSTNVGAQ